MTAMIFAERHRSLAERLSREPGSPIAGWQLLHLPGNLPPWSETDLAVAPGDEVTRLALGKSRPVRVTASWVSRTFTKIASSSAFASSCRPS